MKWLIGIDEAGRGPLAGPVAIGVVAVPSDFDWNLLIGVGDSKQLSEKKREQIFKEAEKLRKAGHINYAVRQPSASVIDKRGIVYAIQSGMKSALDRLAIDPLECSIKLDGSLKAPAVYKDQTTIIGGDASELVIGLASVLAKVTRDRYMVKMANLPQFAPYGFLDHKGYGTKLHREMIKKHGLSDMHRRSFCRNCLI